MNDLFVRGFGKDEKLEDCQLTWEHPPTQLETVTGKLATLRERLLVTGLYAILKEFEPVAESDDGDAAVKFAAFLLLKLFKQSTGADFVHLQ